MENDIWHILGAGSIGSLWASSLSAKGFSVEFILKDDRLTQKTGRSHSLTLTYKNESNTFPVSFTSPATITHPVSQLIVCTKAGDALDAVASIADYLADDAKILLLQNGMGSQKIIAQTFPQYKIWAGSTTDGAFLNSWLNVCHAGRGQTNIGPLTFNAKREDFNKLLSDFHLDVKISDQIEKQLWSKLAINCCINGLTALFNCRNGELLDNTARQERLDELIKETSNILSTQGIEATQLKDRVYQVCKKTANNLSSTCQDARHKRLTELAYINGFLIQYADEHKLPVNKNRRLMSELHQLGIH